MKNVFVFCFCIFAAALCNAQVIYPSPEGMNPSADYHVSINGKEAFVYKSPVPAAYCGFDLDHPVTVKIKANRDVRWVDIRPRSLNIQPSFKDSVITFTINNPCQLSVELNGSIKNPLFIFANPVETNKPKKSDPNVLFFEAGKVHYAGLIDVKSNQTVYVEGGAVVVGAILAKDAENVTVRGRGIIDGTYSNRFNDELIKKGSFDQLPKMEDEERKEIFTCNFLNCKTVLLEGVIFHNSTRWTVVPEMSRRVEINNIKIISDQPSDDGIDVVHCKNVLIHNCFIRTKDDCIAVKSYNLNPKGPDVDSLLAEHCVFWNALWGNALEIGFELNSSEVRNIRFKNSDIIHVEAGAVFSIHNAGTATVKNILFDNIRVEDARQKLFDLAIFRSRYSEDGPPTEEEVRKLYLNGAWDGVIAVPADKKDYHAQFRGKIKNVVFRNINIVEGQFPFSIFYGYNKLKNVSGVRIENLVVNGKKITTIKTAKLSLENADNIIVK